MDLIKKKQKGEKIERPTQRAPSNVVNLMDALRQSVKATLWRTAKSCSIPSQERQEVDRRPA
jgi:non-homologous end joining protein Ku